MHQKSKTGFTLVELSIVLVIIGLLIGGLLIGRNMMDSARMHKVMKEIGAIEYDMHKYKQMFRQFPGDLPNYQSYFGGYAWGNGIQTGDGDGLIGSTEAAGVFVEMNGALGTKYQTCNNAYTFNAFSMNGSCVNFADYSGGRWYVPGHNVPASKAIEKAGLMAIAYGSASYIMYGKEHYTTHVSPELLDGGVFTPTQALAYDKKYDDGVYGTGRMIISQDPGVAGNRCYPFGPAWVDLTYTEPACFLYWQLLPDYALMPE